MQQQETVLRSLTLDALRIRLEPQLPVELHHARVGKQSDVGDVTAQQRAHHLLHQRLAQPLALWSEMMVKYASKVCQDMLLSYQIVCQKLPTRAPCPAPGPVVHTCVSQETYATVLRQTQAAKSGVHDSACPAHPCATGGRDTLWFACPVQNVLQVPFEYGRRQPANQGGHKVECASFDCARAITWYSGSTRTSQIVALNAWSLVARARPISVSDTTSPATQTTDTRSL